MSADPSIAQFERRMAAIPEAVREAVRLAMQNEADRIVEDMFNTAPQGETLRLAGSIGWTWGDAPAGTMVIGTVGGNEYASMKITIFAGGGEAFYARLQEFGTVNMTANPFFFPVWRARRRRVRASISRALRKGIQDAMSKG